VVLSGIEHLEQSGTRVAAVVRADLVDLVEQDHRVHRAGFGDGPDDPARQGADVRATVSTDLRLVPDATEGDPDELPAERAGDRLAQGGLAHPRRTDQGHHGPGPATADDLQTA
jgi:hypothetical protein